MKTIVIVAVLHLFLLSYNGYGQTLTIYADSAAAGQTNESYFFKRGNGSFSAVSLKLVEEYGAEKVLVKFTASVTTASKPSFIKLKFANGQTTTHALKFLRKVDNDNHSYTENLFSFAATVTDIEQLQKLMAKSITLLSARQALLAEIPVTDGRQLQQHIKHIYQQKEN